MIWQALATHWLVEPAREVQARPQDPQFEGLVVTSVSQPLNATPSQSPHPASQEKPQVPLAQVLAVLCTGSVQGAGE